MKSERVELAKLCHNYLIPNINYCCFFSRQFLHTIHSGFSECHGMSRCFGKIFASLFAYWGTFLKSELATSGEWGCISNHTQSTCLTKFFIQEQGHILTTQFRVQILMAVVRLEIYNCDFGVSR